LEVVNKWKEEQVEKRERDRDQDSEGKANGKVRRRERDQDPEDKGDANGKEPTEEEDGPEKDETILIDQDSGDVRRMREMMDPCLPTRAEIEEHRLTHLPFRSWCTFCVKGRG